MGSWLDDFLSRFKHPHLPGRHIYAVDNVLNASLEELAVREQRPVGEIHHDLLSGALEQVKTKNATWGHWQSLSPREQQVAALTCLGYTNRQIASLICVSEETIKTHVRNALVKFALHGKAELRLVLVDWDFSAWDPNPKI